MLNPLSKKVANNDSQPPTAAPTMVTPSAISTPAVSALTAPTAVQRAGLIADPDGRKRTRMAGAIEALLDAGIEPDRVSMTAFLRPFKDQLRTLHNNGKGASMGVIAAKLSEMTGMKVSAKAVGEAIRGKAASARRKTPKAGAHRDRVST